MRIAFYIREIVLQCMSTKAKHLSSTNASRNKYITKPVTPRCNGQSIAKHNLGNCKIANNFSLHI